MLFICYPKCTTCQKAQKWLDARGIKYDFRDIKTDKPSYEELVGWHAKSGLPLKRFWNTSGTLYKGLGISARADSMSAEEQFRLQATDGMLVKRPILVGNDFVLVGFKEEEWTAKIKF